MSKSLGQYLLKPELRKRFYLPEEVAEHNIAGDCFVSFFH